MTGKAIGAALAACAAAAALAGDAAGGGSWLGVFVDDVDGGIELVGLVPGGPADLDGLKRGDVLLRAAGQTLAGLPDLEQVLAGRAPGEPLVLDYLREGRPGRAEVRLGRRGVAPGSAGLALAHPVPDEGIGWILVDVTPDLRRHFGGPADAGVLVSGVTRGRAAAAAGLEVGDLVVALGGRSVADVAETSRSLRDRGQAAMPLRVAIVRAGRPLVAEINLPPAPDSTAAPRQAIEREIERLERRIEALRRQLELTRP